MVILTLCSDPRTEEGWERFVYLPVTANKCGGPANHSVQRVPTQDATCRAHRPPTRSDEQTRLKPSAAVFIVHTKIEKEEAPTHLLLSLL